MVAEPAMSWRSEASPQRSKLGCRKEGLQDLRTPQLPSPGLYMEIHTLESLPPSPPRASSKIMSILWPKKGEVSSVSSLAESGMFWDSSKKVLGEGCHPAWGKAEGRCFRWLGSAA